MSLDKLYKAMAQVEESIDRNLVLFGNYCLVNKSELYNKFKLLYDSLPQELINNREFLNTQKEENILSLLNKISFILDQSKTFCGYIIININTMTEFFDKMYASVLKDIAICQKKVLL